MNLTKPQVDHLNQLIEQGKNLFRHGSLDEKFAEYEEWLARTETFCQILGGENPGRFKQILKDYPFDAEHGPYVPSATEALALFLESLMEAHKLNGPIIVQFSLATGDMELNGNVINFGKNANYFPLLRILFADEASKRKDWQLSELAEKFDLATPPKDKNLYNYFYQMGQKIAIEAGIKDFFLTTLHTVQINPKYLSA